MEDVLERGIRLEELRRRIARLEMGRPRRQAPVVTSGYEVPDRPLP